jgi:hypothetical protein
MGWRVWRATFFLSAAERNAHADLGFIDRPEESGLPRCAGQGGILEIAAGF